MKSKSERQAQPISADMLRAGGMDTLDMIADAISGTHVLALAGAYDAADLAGEAYAATLSGALVVEEGGATRPIATIGDALSVALSRLRPTREGLTNRGGTGAVSVYLSEEDTSADDGDTFGDTLADDVSTWEGRDMARRFASGATFAIAYAQGWDTEGATFTSADGDTLRGGDAIRAARTEALRESTEDAHGAAAAARGAVAQAKSADRDAMVAAALRVVGQPKGYAAKVAEHLGWITADSTKGERLAAMNRVRVAVSRLAARTDGDNSHSARD